MPLRRRNRRFAPKATKIDRSYQHTSHHELNYITQFIKWIVSLSSGLTALAIFGYLLTLQQPEVNIVYQFVLVVNTLILVSGLLHIKQKSQKK